VSVATRQPPKPPSPPSGSGKNRGCTGQLRLEDLDEDHMDSRLSSSHVSERHQGVHAVWVGAIESTCVLLFRVPIWVNHAAGAESSTSLS